MIRIVELAYEHWILTSWFMVLGGVVFACSLPKFKVTWSKVTQEQPAKGSIEP